MHSAPSTKKGRRVFSASKSDREVEVAQTAGVAARTHKNTKYCVGLWESWCEWR